MANSEWILLASLVCSALAIAFGYLRNPSLIPAGRANEMRQQIEDLRAENAACRAENAKLAGRVSYLESTVETLRSEAHWWQEQFRDLKSETPRRRRGPPKPDKDSDP